MKGTREQWRHRYEKSLDRQRKMAQELAVQMDEVARLQRLLRQVDANEPGVNHVEIHKDYINHGYLIKGRRLVLIRMNYRVDPDVVEMANSRGAMLDHAVQEVHLVLNRADKDIQEMLNKQGSPAGVR
jgi:hypothetical protein